MIKLDHLPAPYHYPQDHYQQDPSQQLSNVSCGTYWRIQNQPAQHTTDDQDGVPPGTTASSLHFSNSNCSAPPQSSAMTNVDQSLPHKRILQQQKQQFTKSPFTDQSNKEKLPLLGFQSWKGRNIRSSSDCGNSRSGGDGGNHWENEKPEIQAFSESPESEEVSDKWIGEYMFECDPRTSYEDSHASKRAKLNSRSNSFNNVDTTTSSSGPRLSSTFLRLRVLPSPVSDHSPAGTPSGPFECRSVKDQQRSLQPLMITPPADQRSLQSLIIANEPSSLPRETQLPQRKRPLNDADDEDINTFMSQTKSVIVLPSWKTSSNDNNVPYRNIRRSNSMPQPRIIAKPRHPQPGIRYLQSEDEKESNQNEFSILNIIPTLISEKHRKAAFVENLVDMAALIIEVIWQNFHINPAAKIIPLRIFLQETLRRSRTSYSTLQTALFYIYRVKSQITQLAHVPPNANGSTDYPLTPTSEVPPQRRENNDPATCGRRMFLAALIVASKYLQDRNYSNKAWSKISGLPVNEINQNEIVFLKLIDYNLFIAEDIFKRWSSLLLTHIQSISGSTMDNANAFRQAENQRAIECFRETLRTMDPQTMECSSRKFYNDSRNIFPITPDQSAPASPKEEKESPLHSISQKTQQMKLE